MIVGRESVFTVTVSAKAVPGPRGGFVGAIGEYRCATSQAPSSRCASHRREGIVPVAEIVPRPCGDNVRRRAVPLAAQICALTGASGLEPVGSIARSTARSVSCSEDSDEAEPHRRSQRHLPSGRPVEFPSHTTTVKWSVKTPSRRGQPDDVPVLRPKSSSSNRNERSSPKASCSSPRIGEDVDDEGRGDAIHDLRWLGPRPRLRTPCGAKSGNSRAPSSDRRVGNGELEGRAIGAAEFVRRAIVVGVFETAHALEHEAWPRYDEGRRVSPRRVLPGSTTRSRAPVPAQVHALAHRSPRFRSMVSPAPVMGRGDVIENGGRSAPRSERSP